jgi:protein-S-isoprenylcysteine O-methyltransferase Ste14
LPNTSASPARTGTGWTPPVLAFAAVFAVGLPGALLVWALTVPVHFDLWLPPRWVGVALCAVGAALLVWAVATYILRTGTLPVSLLPPQAAIVTGPYWLLNDPIYTGFCMLVFGVAIAFAHPFSFWFLAPAVSVATYCYALGVEARVRPRRPEGQAALLGLPKGALPLPPPLAIATLGAHLFAIATASFVLSATEIAALWGAPAMLGGLVAFAIALAGTGAVAVIRVRGMIGAMYVGAMLFFVIAYAPGDAGGDSSMLAVAAIAAGAAARLATSAARAVVAAIVALAVLPAFSLVAPVGLVEMASLATLALLVYVLPDLYRLAVQLAELIANSWGSVRLGPVRIINYAGFAFLSATTGCLVFAAFTGDGAVAGMSIIALLTLLGAGLWGQLLESTGRLARPFGYFGAMIGAVLGTLLAAWATGMPAIAVGAALALAAPWIQAIGRVRCLVQGCCHGRPVEVSGLGISYRSRHARAVAIGGFFDTPIYPTQLFSLLCNVFLGLLLLRLALSGTPAALIVAVYWLGAGSSRFAEEAFRGEPQTRIVGGLKIYQWFSVLLILAAIAMTYVASDPIAILALPGPAAIAMAVVLGLIYGIAMGVDFPDAGTRLSRLTPSD